jgi:hypothetical protein
MDGTWLDPGGSRFYLLASWFVFKFRSVFWVRCSGFGAANAGTEHEHEQRSQNSEA